MKRYNPKEIEPKWQAYWDENQTYKADLRSDKPKFMAMSMFNYPSGAGIHIGHAMNYTISDVLARFKRQQGYESYHPVGWDAFGLPAENYAIKAGVSPQASMATIIPDYHKQYKAMGWSNDWSKEISTHVPEYYQWTQWIFSQVYKNGMAYQDSRFQWWCTKCQTVLANEQVIDGKCWRHDSADDLIVEKKEVKQWFFKITDYADELLEATDDLDWTETVKTAQRNWIGKSIGAEITFKVESGNIDITVFTTRPDTLFGATFLVLAPEHELVNQLIVKSEKLKVESYIKEAGKKTEVERQASKDKTGVFTGSYAINPATNEPIPIWIADYVLVGYGTGAIMAVPAHDERDNEFAKKFALPIISVVEPVFGLAQGDETHKVGVIVILRNPVDNTVLILDWGPRMERWGGKMLIGGSVEEGEDIVECAIREIAEETGYTDVKLVSRSEQIGHGYFYSNVKNKNYSIDAHGLYFELVSDKKSELNLDEGEKNKFSVQWVPAPQVAAQLDDGIHKYFFETLVEGFCHHGEGIMVNSGRYNGMKSSDVRELIVKDLNTENKATEKTIYKLRDWSVSRQRYWGAPIPIIHCKDCGQVLVPDDQLPVVLPELTDFAPNGDGRSALARATDWLTVPCPKCNGPAERETDTMDTYVCSSWYMLRYLDPANSEKIFDSNIANKWMPVDFYNGADHATAHLIYARFMTRFFSKLGLIDNPEPFKKFLYNGKLMAQNGEMFSKSKGNGVDPLEIINSGYGADALRTYLMFAAPLELWIRWDPKGVPGTFRFINRVWNLVQEFSEQSNSNSPQAQASKKVESESSKSKLLRAVHQATKKVTADLEDLKYNTAIAGLMKCTNDLYDIKAKDGFTNAKDWQTGLESMVSMMAPFAPHAAEELWHDLGHDDSVNRDHWPVWDDEYILEDTITIAIQVNGKLRGTVTVAADMSKEAIIAAALASDRVKIHINGEPKKTIYVPGKLVNLVV